MNQQAQGSAEIILQIQQQLLEALRKIDRPGTFCASGRLPAVIPGLEVAGLGSVALPLEKRQASALKKLSRQAPYGKGTQTVVDTDVRRVWEIDAGQVSLTNPEWQDVLKHAVGAARSSLGLEKQNLEAHLYKLLLYEKGSFFLAHRDGEKLDRMVATLVIALPSVHEGGELVVRHEGREVTVDFGPASRFQTQFAAFYADCEHEIRPVTSGFRLALIYNLTLQKSKQTISAPTSHEHIAGVALLLSQWSSQSRTAPATSKNSAPSKLAVLLDHQYTQAGLTCDALKGIDRARADVLFTAAREAGCDASLALVTYWESGSAEPSGDYGYESWRDRNGYDEDGDYDDQDGSEHVMGEVFDSSLIVGHFRDVDGCPLTFGEIPLSEEEIVANLPLTDGAPDKEDFEDYTGNAGMTLERWYRRAAVVLWPAESRFDVLCEAGMEAAVGGLGQMVRHWKQAKEGDQEALKQTCLEFAGRIIDHWPEGKYASGYHHVTYGASDFDDDDDEGHEEEDDEDFEGDDADDEDFDDEDEDPESLGHDGKPAEGAVDKVFTNPLLSVLEKLGDVSLIIAWLRSVLAKDASVDPGQILGNLCEQYGWTTFQDELQKLFEHTSSETLERNARLLSDWSQRKDKSADRGTLCSHLARQIMSAVERCNLGRSKADWQSRVIDLPKLLHTLVQAFLALDETKLFECLVTYVLDRPMEFNLTKVQVPTLLGLETWLRPNVKHASPVLSRWVDSVNEELQSRASHPPQEPADWRRESDTGCNCTDCKELSRFLNDPKEKTLRLPLSKERRHHIHQVIDRKKLDTTHVTERIGRPHTLVCTKKRGAYDRELESHRIDVDQLGKIGRLVEWLRGLNAETIKPAQDTAKSKIRKRK